MKNVQEAWSHIKGEHGGCIYKVEMIRSLQQYIFYLKTCFTFAFLIPYNLKPRERCIFKGERVKKMHIKEEWQNVLLECSFVQFSFAAVYKAFYPP